MAEYKNTASSSGGGWWEPLLNVGANILGNVASASIANRGINQQVDAARDANAASTQLQREMFNTNMALSRPYYQGGGNAFNLLSRIYGLPTQDFNFKGANSFGGSLASDGSQLLPNFGAGQPVAGHSNLDYTGSALVGGLGSAVGSIFGGPVGGVIGGLAGSLIRPDGDNWQTLATQAPGGYDYDAYMAQDPGLMAEWNKPDVQSLFNGNRDAYAYWHYNKFGPKGAGQNWTLNKAAGDKSNQPVGGATEVGGGGGSNSFLNDDPMQLFWDSPYGKMATDQFLTVDNPAIKGAYATAGKSLSGAQQKALADRGRATGGNAFNNYTSGLSQMAGLGPMASTQIQSAGNNFANAVSANNTNTANVVGQGAAARNANWSNAFNNAASGAYDYAKGAGWV